MKLKLTDNQKNSLAILKEEKSLAIDGNKVNRNTMNSLYFKSLVRCPRYANGKFWELTDSGYEAASNFF